MSVVLYQIPHSPYAIPIRQTLVACGVSFEIRNIPGWDRSEIIRLTEGAYYQVPLLMHDDRPVFESSADSLDVARYVDATWAGGWLFPPALEAANLCLTEWLEGEVEARTFKLADIRYVPGIGDLVGRVSTLRHKERRFGHGCLKQWSRDAPVIRGELDRLLHRCEDTLRRSPFLLGATPVYADFALCGVLGNLCHNDWNELTPAQSTLKEFRERLSAWRYALSSNAPGAVAKTG